MDERQLTLKELQEELYLCHSRERVLYEEIENLYTKYYALHELLLKQSPHTTQQDINALQEEKEDKEEELYARTRKGKIFEDLYDQRPMRLG